MAMNEETQAVYAKYGVSPTGSCLQLIIQMPILFALYRVIMNVPAYVNGIKDILFSLQIRLWQLLAVLRLWKNSVPMEGCILKEKTSLR